MRVRLTQIDGTLPNLALMRLAAWHRAQGHAVRWEPSLTRTAFEGEPYDIVYDSAIFGADEDSQAKVRLFRSQWPQALIGGSGGDPRLRVDRELDPSDTHGVPGPVPAGFVGLDYSGFPDFTASLGYAMRGCRFRCRRFCIVPDQEGRARAAATIEQIWRGSPYPKRLHLLDNDFFGNPDWRAVVRALLDGDYRVCINQGINVRLLADKQRDADEQAEALAALKLRDTAFRRRRLYTAWDNIGHERVFFQGLERLVRAGFRPGEVMAYMLIGADPRETWARLFYRYRRMVDAGIRPYPMPLAPKRRGLAAGDTAGLSPADRDAVRGAVARGLTLADFQGWVITGAHRVDAFGDFQPSHRARPAAGGLLALMGDPLPAEAIAA